MLVRISFVYFLEIHFLFDNHSSIQTATLALKPFKSLELFLIGKSVGYSYLSTLITILQCYYINLYNI